MRFGKTIGRLVLCHADPSLEGARYLIVKPLSLAQFKDPESSDNSGGPSLVVYDALGAREGDIIGFTEGGEAMLPFDERVPVDAYNAIVVDRMNYFGA